MKVKLLTSPVQVRHQKDIAIKLLAQCYQSKNMTFDKLLNIALIKKHQTVLECFDLTFLIEGISYASHVHFVRHRFTTPFVESQRYTGVGVTRILECILDKLNDDEILELGKYDQLVSSLFHHKTLTLQEQRYLKPQGALINMGIKMNLREFMHIVELRTAPDAMEETQIVAKAMLEEVKKDEVLRRFFK